MANSPRDAALLQVSQVMEIDRPADDRLKFLRDWLRRPEKGSLFLREREETIWQDANHRDLVTFRRRPLETDAFSGWLSTTFLDIYDRYWGHREQVRAPNSINDRDICTIDFDLIN